MLRLASRMMVQRKVVLPAAAYENAADRLAATELFVVTRDRLADGIPLIVADNVADYFHTYPDYKVLPDIPCPPAFTECAIEWAWPSGRSSFLAHLVSTEDRNLIEEATQQRPSGPSVIGDQPGIIRPWVVAETRWLLVCKLFVYSKGGSILPIGIFYVGLNSDGYYLQWPFANAFLNDEVFPTGDPSSDMTALWQVIYFTLAFMQIKSTQRVDVTDEEGPSPKWCRRMRVPELKYHKLQIMPATRRNNGRKTDGDRSGKAFHICRGHFVHYVDDGVCKGLFGKGIYGTFWIPAHTRGSRVQGQVVSEYTVQVPQCPNTMTP